MMNRSNFDPDSPMQSGYEEWLADRRDLDSPDGLADQIMGQVFELDQQRSDGWRMRLVQRVERSPAFRYVVCGGALAVGALPFIFIAYAAKFFEF